MPVEVVGSVVGNLGEVAGLRVGLKPSLTLPKNIPVQTLQFDKLSLHHASGQLRLKLI